MSQLLIDIESFIACLNISVAEFEKEAGARGVVRRLRKGATVRAATEDRIRTFMDAECNNALAQIPTPPNPGSCRPVNER